MTLVINSFRDQVAFGAPDLRMPDGFSGMRLVSPDIGGGVVAGPVTARAVYLSGKSVGQGVVVACRAQGSNQCDCNYEECTGAHGHHFAFPLWHALHVEVLWQTLQYLLDLVRAARPCVYFHAPL